MSEQPTQPTAEEVASAIYHLHGAACSDCSLAADILKREVERLQAEATIGRKVMDTDALHHFLANFFFRFGNHYSDTNLSSELQRWLREEER